jgi:hypothetical protein
MSPWARYTIGIASFLTGCLFPLVGFALHNEVPLGIWPFLAMGALCLVVTTACFVPRTWPITLRIIGATVFLAYAGYIGFSINTPNFWQATKGFVVIGLPFGAMALFARYPRWGHGADALQQDTVESENPPLT